MVAPLVTGSRRLQAIDGLRGCAALAVVLYHASVINALYRTGWEGSWADVVFGFGRFGVWLFFVISGFCIHLRWASDWTPERTPRLDFLAFWKRRFIRLYPPYAIALAMYVAWLVYEGLRPTGAAIWHIVSHVVLLNNFDRGAVESVNGVFWTLAIEEQLYLAYFLLLKLRIRFGWAVTLACCLGARIGWFALAALLHQVAGVDLLVTQAAAAQWIVWALGALAVEASFGIVKLPAIWRYGWFGTGLLVVAAIATYQTGVMTGGLAKNLVWLATDVVWGLGFFIWINRAADLEARWRARGRRPVWLAPAAALGLFSYSTYLTHELLMSHVWPLVQREAPTSMTVMTVQLVVLTALSLVFARLFFAWFERPFMMRSREKRVSLSPVPAV